MNGNREFRSDVFCMLMEYPEKALDVYNALNGTAFTDPSLVKIVTMKKGISLSVRNDAAFVINTDLQMYEHQSTYCPNMPVRSLIYFTNTIMPMLKDEDIYGKSLIKLPNPHFIVFYNGEEKRPEKEILKLSDAFMHKDDISEIELIVTVYNINGNSSGILDKSKVLREYMQFVDKVRARKRNVDALSEDEYSDIVELAVDECITEGIMADFLTERKWEVIKAMTLDYTFERREEIMKKKTLQEGIDIGKKQTLLDIIDKKLQKGMDIATIAREVEESEDYINELLRDSGFC